MHCIPCIVCNEWCFRLFIICIYSTPSLKTKCSICILSLVSPHCILWILFNGLYFINFILNENFVKFKNFVLPLEKDIFQVHETIRRDGGLVVVK